MSRLPAPSHVSAGLIAVLVGFTSSAVIIFQAAAAAGADAVLVGGVLASSDNPRELAAQLAGVPRRGR